MKRRDFLIGSALAPVAATGLAAPAIAQGTIEWKLPSAFPAKAPGVGTNVMSFADRVATMSDGRLTMKVFSGGELVPAFGVEDAVQQGVAEIGHTPSYFNAGKVPAAHFYTGVPFGMSPNEFNAWLIWGDGQKLWDEIYAKRGLKPFYCGNSGVQSGGWFKKEINSVADLSGLNMRIGGLGAEVMRKVGVNAVTLPPAEIFPAFQSGAIDAAEWVGPMLDMAFGLQQIAKLCYVPAFGEPGAALEIVVNKDAYEALPADLQAIIANAAHAASVEMLAQFDYFNVTAFNELEAQGVEFRNFPDDVIAAFQKASAEVMDEIAAEDEDFARVRKSYDDFLVRSTPYQRLFQAASFEQRPI